MPAPARIGNSTFLLPSLHLGAFAPALTLAHDRHLLRKGTDIPRRVLGFEAVMGVLHRRDQISGISPPQTQIGGRCTPQGLVTAERSPNPK